jgi:hypothetical protein
VHNFIINRCIFHLRVKCKKNYLIGLEKAKTNIPPENLKKTLEREEIDKKKFQQTTIQIDIAQSMDDLLSFCWT